MELRLEGRYRHRLERANGTVEEVGWRANRVVDRGLDLLAGLLAERAGWRGLLYWAVGSGDPAWDAAPEPPAPSPRESGLVNEIFRRRLDAGRDLRFDPATGRLHVHLRFEPGEGTGTWRELGLFGGDATPLPGSGVLFNVARHPRLEKGEGDALERELVLSLGSPRLSVAGRALLLRLLARERVHGLTHVAVGSGDPAWDAALPPPDPQARALHREVLRRPLRRRALRYDAAARALLVEVDLPFDAAPETLREIGLFGGGDEGSPPELIYAEAHAGIDRTVPRALARTLRLALTARVEVAVPDLAGRPLDVAAGRLEAAGLRLGRVGEREEAGVEGRVLAQEPPAGARVPEGSAVALLLRVAPRVEVPDLGGMSLESAAALLARRGLQAGEQRGREARVPAGTVLEQSPRAGQRVERGASVLLIVATPRTVEVPEVTGGSRGEAEARLRAAGLAPAEQSAAGISDAPPGTVLAQVPAAGERVPEGSEVLLTLATPHAVELPDLTGLELDEAVRRLRNAAAPVLAAAGLSGERAGLAIGEMSERASDARPGTVVAQVPATGTLVPLFTAIAVEVAGRAQSRVPELRGLARAEAEAALAAAGLAAGEIAERDAREAAGTVLAQEHPAGTSLPRGSALALVVARAERVEVPELVGRSLEAAREALSGRRLALGPVTQRVVSGSTGVLEQVPPAGALASVGTAVALVVAGGVPSVLGLPLAGARDRLQAAGLALAPGASAEVSAVAAEGTVLRQDPPAGASARPGAAVAVVLAARVPNVVGLSLDEASARLTAVALARGAVTDEEVQGNGGTILRQAPAAGAAAEPGSAVALVLAVPRRVRVPVIVGATSAEARRLLTDAALGLAIGAETESDGEPGRVLTQQPAANAVVARGSEVRATVSTRRTVVVPNVLQRAQAEALTALAAAGLAGEIAERVESGAAAGLVLRQEPPAGARAVVGSAVRLAVSVRTVVVPGIVGQHVERAAVTLNGLELRLAETRRERSEREGGTVLEQEPPAGKRVDAGSTVAVVVAEERADGPRLAALWPPNGAVLSPQTLPGALDTRKWLRQWRERPRLELTFTRAMDRGRLKSVGDWLRLWFVENQEQRRARVLRLPLHLSDLAERGLLGEIGPTAIYALDPAQVANLTGRFLVQIRVEREEIFDDSLQPLDADLAGTKLSRELLDAFWRVEDKATLPLAAWEGLRTSGAAAPSGDGRPGGLLHAGFEIEAERVIDPGGGIIVRPPIGPIVNPGPIFRPGG